MVTAYFKLIIEDDKVEESQGMSETSVEALTPVGAELPGVPLARAWYPVGVEKILRACRQDNPEAEAVIPPFSARDPGFEHPWDEEDTYDDADISPSDLSRCC
eukprot:UN3457